MALKLELKGISLGRIALGVGNVCLSDLIQPKNIYCIPLGSELGRRGLKRRNIDRIFGSTDKFPVL